MILLLLLLVIFYQNSASDPEVEFWLTTANKSVLFQKQNNVVISKNNIKPDIEIFKNKQQQPIDGFGWCLTGGSASLIQNLPDVLRTNLLQGKPKKKLNLTFIYK